jgi:hypothetical protein
MIYYRYKGFPDQDEDEICTAYACDVKGERLPTRSVVEMRQGDLIMFLADKEDTSQHSIGLHLNSCQLMFFTKHWVHYELITFDETF